MGMSRQLGRRLSFAGFVCAAAVAMSAPASASAAPVVTTSAATSWTSTSAILNGTVTSAGPSATYSFEYVTSAGYGQSTSEAPLGGATTVAAQVTGLSPGSTYHFRLVVVDAPGSPPTAGQDAVFTTPASPGTVATTGQATSITSTSAELNGVTDSVPGSSWYFQYGKSTAYDHRTSISRVPAGVVAVSAKLSGLAPTTTYHYRLVVAQGFGVGVDQGADRSFATSRPSGIASLRGHRFEVRRGAAAFPFGCRGVSGAQCNAKISLSTRIRAGKRVQIVRCGNGKLATSAGHSHKVKLKLGPHCGSLLHHATGQRLKASLDAAFSTTQAPLRIAVTLLGT